MQLVENTVVANRFRLGRMIGRGGMGSVWAATQIGLERPCALKFIEGEMAKLAEAHQRFEREARAAAQLASPHIVQIYDHGVWEETPYIAMELLEGEDLGHRLTARGGKLSPGELHPIVMQICRALAKAHAAGIVHRDLKPDNVFLVRDDDREIVKILDFGVAKSASQALEGSNTRTGAMLGTPYYMSPEQAQGIKSVDFRSDLWSLAVIVYQCMTGHLPFESEALGDLLVKIIVAPIPVPSQVAPVPPAFDRWWERAADRKPELRFQSAKELAESLGLALGLSSPGEVTEITRGAARIGGGTAVMSNANLPPPRPHAESWPGVTASPPLGTLPDGGAPAPHGTTGGVASTYGGANALPKKGLPLAAVLGIAFGAVAVLGVGAFAILSRAHGTAEVKVATSAHPASSAPPPVVASAEPVPTPAASATTAPVASVSAAPVASTTASPVASATTAPKAQVVQPVVAQPKETAGTATKPTGSKAKPKGDDFGF